MRKLWFPTNFHIMRDFTAHAHLQASAARGHRIPGQVWLPVDATLVVYDSLHFYKSFTNAGLICQILAARSLAAVLEEGMSSPEIKTGVRHGLSLYDECVRVTKVNCGHQVPAVLFAEHTFKSRTMKRKLSLVSFFNFHSNNYVIRSITQKRQLIKVHY